MRTYQPLSEYAPAKPPLPNTDPEPESLPPSSVVGAAELIAAGCEPLEMLTGIVEIVEDWPNEYRRALPETRTDRPPGEENDAVWFIRSPWPSLTPKDALSVLWTSLPRENEASWPAVTREVLSWPDERALSVFRRLWPGED